MDVPGCTRCVMIMMARMPPSSSLATHSQRDGARLYTSGRWLGPASLFSIARTTPACRLQYATPSITAVCRAHQPVPQNSFRRSVYAQVLVPVPPQPASQAVPGVTIRELAAAVGLRLPNISVHDGAPDERGRRFVASARCRRCAELVTSGVASVSRPGLGG